MFCSIFIVYELKQKNVHHVLDPGGKEENVLFNDAVNTFYLWLYDVGHMI